MKFAKRMSIIAIALGFWRMTGTGWGGSDVVAGTPLFIA